MNRYERFCPCLWEGNCQPFAIHEQGYIQAREFQALNIVHTGVEGDTQCECHEKTSMTMATESSGYMWLRITVILDHNSHNESKNGKIDKTLTKLESLWHCLTILTLFWQIFDSF